MNFTSYTFLLFFAIIGLLYYVLPRTLQNALLLAASYVFYMWAAPQYGVVLFLTTAVTFLCARWMDKQQSATRRKLVLALLTVLNLGVLFVFKYYNFFADALKAANVALPEMKLAITAGLSFYTFQLVGYCIDVYRKNVEAEKNAIDFALFISFFPQLLSGPIGRAGELLPQYKKPREPQYENFRDGSLRFLLGVFKKMVVADGIARYVDATYANLQGSYGLTILLTIILYALQIYFDFSAYTDMALGAAQFLGLRLRENFFVPYAGATLGEFWARWHMSLSTWFRDYLYIPLGGNRKGFLRKLINILIVFAVSGLWHGAALTFVLWGVWHGVFRMIEEIVLKLRKQKKPEFKTKRSKICGIVVTNILVFFGWVLFRADHLSNIPVIAKNLFVMKPLGETVNWIYGVMAASVSSSPAYAKFTLVLLILAAVLALVFDGLTVRSEKSGVRQHNPLLCVPMRTRTVLCVFMVFCILVIGEFGSSSFIYYQF